jgi:hypothetical protein
LTEEILGDARLIRTLYCNDADCVASQSGG